MAQSPFEIKKEICDIGKRIYDHGFVAANDGNISVKVNDNEFYCTPTGVSKGDLTPDMIIRIDGKGNNLEFFWIEKRKIPKGEQKGKGILAARNAYRNDVARLYHIVILNRPSCKA